MRLRLELMQLEIGMSTSRYLPASGTAGFERSLVRGNKRLPAPPPMITARTLTVFGADRFCPISPHLLTPLSHANASPRNGATTVIGQSLLGFARHAPTIKSLVSPCIDLYR